MENRPRDKRAAPWGAAILALLLGLIHAMLIHVLPKHKAMVMFFLLNMVKRLTQLMVGEFESCMFVQI